MTGGNTMAERTCCDRTVTPLSPPGCKRRWRANRGQVLVVIAGLVACLSACGDSPSPPDPALAKVGPAPCGGVTGDYTNIAYAVQLFAYSDGATIFQSIMGYLSVRGNLPRNNAGLNKFMLNKSLGIEGPYSEIWVEETIPGALQDVLEVTPDPIGVFARNVTFEWQTLDRPKQGVRLSVKRLSDLSFCHGGALLTW